jgi:hypothetical protein
MPPLDLLRRFDHAIIAVRDLAAASDRLANLGLTVSPGGIHPGRGTHNAIVRFGTDYIELLSVRDRSEREATGASGERLLSFLDRGEGLFGWVVATDDSDAVAHGLRDRGYTASTVGMQRTRADGRVLSWKLVAYGAGTPGFGPGIIHWEAADADRLSWEQPTPHALGADRVWGVVVRVPDVDSVARFYAEGLRLQRQDGRAFMVGGTRIELVDAGGDAPGLHQLVLHVDDLERAAAKLHAAGVEVPAISGGRVEIPPEAACGARLVLTDAG